MITHYLKVALRNLLKYKAHSVASAWPAVRRIPQPTSIGNWMTSVIWMNNP